MTSTLSQDERGEPVARSEQSVTLQDIAREANLSVSAVSKALGNYPQVNELTRQRVLRISERLNYRPRRRHAGGRRVGAGEGAGRAGGIRGTAGVVLFETDQSGERGTRWVTLLTRAADECQLRLELCNVTRADADQRSSLKDRLGHLGAVLMFGCVSLPVLEALRDVGVPCVVLGDLEGRDHLHRLPCYQVVSDKVAMGELATRSLIEAGHRRIGFFCASYPSGGWNDQWLTGYQLALMRAGLAVDPQVHPVFEAVDRDEVGVTAAEHMAALDERPTAYVVPTIHGAARFRDTMKVHGIELGPDRLVMGGNTDGSVEDQALYGLSGYPVVGEDASAMTRSAIELVARLVDGATPPLSRIVLPHRVRNF